MLQAGKSRVRIRLRSLNFFSFTCSFQPRRGLGVDSASDSTKNLSVG
jgi:hypothetical protein